MTDSILLDTADAGAMGPGSKEASRDLALDGPSLRTPTSGFYVLIVDDEVPIQNVFRRMVRGTRIEIRCASSADEALGILEKEAHFVAGIISDNQMPGRDGVSFLSEVRRRWPSIRRVLLTSLGDAALLERAINDAGVSQFLRKPLTLPATLELMEATLLDADLRRDHELLLERLRNRNDELSYVNQLLTKELSDTDQVASRMRRRWDQALHAITDPIFIVNGAGRIEGMNRAAEKLTGQALSENEGRIATEVHLTPDLSPEGQSVRTAPGRFVVASGDGERVYQIESHTISEDGTKLCIYRDVTESERFHRHASQIDKMAALGRLAGEVAHEINNPLHAILSFVQLAQRPNTPPDKLARYLEVIRESALRCRDIVDLIRGFSRQPSEKTAHGPVHLDELCKSTLAMFGAAAGRIQLQSSTAVLVAGHAGELRQVLVNLLQNALDASPAGVAVDLSLEIRDDQVVLSVEDAGSGVPENLRTRIFEPFYTTKPEGKGTGLGLSISHRIALEHGGSLLCTNSRLGGARFELRLRPIPGAHDGEVNGD